MILCCYFQLLRTDPAERLGADCSDLTVREHSFFHWIDWKALEKKKVEPPEVEVVGVRFVFQFFLICMEIIEMPSKLEFNLL